MTPKYRGGTTSDKPEFMEPYAVVYASLDFGHTNISASCECPIIKRNQ